MCKIGYLPVSYKIIEGNLQKVLWNNAVRTPGSPQDSNRFWKTDQVVTCGISRNTETTGAQL